MRIPRVYVDTSVFGGCFDEPFREASLRFFDMVRRGELRLVASSTTLRELADAPLSVRGLLEGLPPDSIEWVEWSDEIGALRDAYLEARVVGSASLLDAEHVATATVAGVDLVVSWNFRHIVHFQKIEGYNGVNLLCGYRGIRIHSPLEVVYGNNREGL